MRRAETCRVSGYHFVDVGTSGGVRGLAEGYSMMVGGDVDGIETLRPIFETLAPAPNKGGGRTGDSGEGRWTVFEAIDRNVAAPVITLSLMRRIGSRDEIDYSDRSLSAMRNQFGGHAMKRES